MIFFAILLLAYGLYLIVMLLSLWAYSRLRPGKSRRTIFLVFLVFPFACNYLVQLAVISANKDSCPDKNGLHSAPPPKGGVFISGETMPKELREEYDARRPFASISRYGVAERHDAWVPLGDFYRIDNQIPVYTDFVSWETDNYCPDENLLTSCLSELFPDTNVVRGINFEDSRKSNGYSWARLTSVFWETRNDEPELVSLWERFRLRKGNLWWAITPWGDRDFYICSTQNRSFDSWYLQGITE